MSEENVEIVRSVYERWNRNDGDLALDLLDPDIEIRQTATVFDTAGTFHGHAGLRASARELFEAWRRIEWLPIRWTDRGDWLIVPVDVTAVGHHSGIPTQMKTCHAWRLDRGRVTEFYVYDTEAEALEAAGLSE